MSHACAVQVGTRITAGEERRPDEVAWALDILVQDGSEESTALVWGCLKVSQGRGVVERG